jgi:sialic acid synthase SpsE
MKEFKIGEKVVGGVAPVFIVAEMACKSFTEF